MVLDTVIDGKFIFKITFADNQQVAIPDDKRPLEFYYLHMEITENGLEQLKMQKKS